MGIRAQPLIPQNSLRSRKAMQPHLNVKGLDSSIVSATFTKFLVNFDSKYVPFLD